MPSLKPDRIAGVGGLPPGTIRWPRAKPARITCCSASRTPRASGPRAKRSPSACEWWAELFEPPCVGFAVSLRGSPRIRRSRRGFRAGRRFHLGRSARRRGGARTRRTGDQASARRSVRKSQSRTGIAPEMKTPASHIDPRFAGELADAPGRRHGANSAAAAARRRRRRVQPPREEREAQRDPSRSRRRPPRSRAGRDAEARRHAGANGDRHARARLRRSQCRSGLRRLSARPLQDRVRSGDQPRAVQRRSQGDDHARRTLRQRDWASSATMPRPPNGTSAPPTAATARACSRSR